MHVIFRGKQRDDVRGRRIAKAALYQVYRSEKDLDPTSEDRPQVGCPVAHGEARLFLSLFSGVMSLVRCDERNNQGAILSDDFSRSLNQEALIRATDTAINNL